MMRFRWRRRTDRRPRWTYLSDTAHGPRHCENCGRSLAGVLTWYVPDGQHCYCDRAECGGEEERKAR